MSPPPGATEPSDPASAGGARSAIGFLTVLGGSAPLTPAARNWFGPIGLVVGGLVGLAWWAGGQILPAAVAAGLALVVDLGLTGLLHVDGLADTADGLLPPMDRQRRLAVMRQPDVGPFGVAAVVVVLGLRWSALAALTPDVEAEAILAVAGLWALSRTAMAIALVAVPAARPGGLAAAFAGSAGSAGRRAGRRPPIGAGVGPVVGAIVGLGLAGLALLGGSGWPGLAAGAGGLLAGAALMGLAVRRLGGCTGDVLGATGLVVETVGLVVATVWA